MRIAFDGRVISGNKSGVGVYAESLLNALVKLEELGCTKVFTNDGIQSNNKIDPIRTAGCLEDHPVGDLWEQFYLPFYIYKEKIDIFHSPTFHHPFFSPGVKKVVTIHDLVSFRFPETQPKGFAAYSRFMIKMAVKSADGIIVPSEAVKSELLDTLKVKARVHVVPEAPRSIFGVSEDENKCAEIRNKYKLPDRFIIFVGSIEPRKNLSSLINAFVSLKKNYNILQKLIIAGGKGWMKEYEKLLNLADKTGIISEVFFTGYVPDEDLPALYNLSDLFVYPSLYEGFGLPPLEAMACGCPVIASMTPAIEEIVGDAGVLINPLDVAGLSEAIYRVLSSDSFRSSLREAGFKRVTQFSWEKAALETLKVYKKVLKD